MPPFQFSAWQWQNTYGERPITDTLSALIFDNLFGRFPNIKVLVSEFGAEWVPHFIRHMDKSRGMGRNGRWLGGQLPERPSAIFKKHVRVVPYPEDDTVGLVERLGAVEAPRHGLGLAPRRRACASRPTSTPGSKGSARSVAGSSSATTPWSSSAPPRKFPGGPIDPCTTGGVVARLERPGDHPSASSRPELDPVAERS